MKLYNTLTRKIEDFIPNEEGIVKLYTCGPTVYHFAHIGNLRSYIQEDVLEKYLNYAGYKVERVMNITDVGHLTGDSDDGSDKMEKRKKRENKSVLDIAKFYIENEDIDYDISSDIKAYFDTYEDSFYIDYFIFLVLFIYIRDLIVDKKCYICTQNFIYISNAIKKFNKSFDLIKQTEK